jgi:hypothetical protein
LVEIGGNRELTGAEPERSGLGGRRRNWLDFRYGTGIPNDKEGLPRFDTVEKGQWVSLDFLDANRTHQVILPGKAGPG